MRLTALCLCGTLLAFSSLCWITADSDGVLLDLDKEFGPCTATLTPEEPCRQGQHESTCPYLFSLPPLTVQLPQQLRELDKIVQDLEKLKDSVDQLREMCADCTVSHTERECERQREREHEKPNEGEDERSWINGRLQESDRNQRQECGTHRGKVENMEGDGDAEKRLTLEEKEKTWKAERESDKGVLKENGKEPVTEVAEQDGKTKTEGTKEKDKLGQTKVPTPDGNERIVDTVREKVADKNNRESETDRYATNASKESSKGYQGDKLEKDKERKTTSNLNNKEKTEESEHHVWQDETKETQKKPQTEARDRIKMSEDHDVNTNTEQEESGEKRKKEMEKGTNVEQNNEKPKQPKSIGHTEKERTIKEEVEEEEEEEEEEEDRETGKEIKTEDEKTESAQGYGDGGLSSSKAIERTDFVSIGPTPDSTISIASRPDSSDSNKAIIFTSSLPSPPLPSSTSDLIINVSHETLTAYGPTQGTGLGAAGISEPPNSDAKSAAATGTMNTLGGQRTTSNATKFNSASRVKPGTGFQGHVSSPMTTTTPYENLYVTAFPGVTDHSRWTAKKNISSNTKTGVKPLPGRGPKPGEKHKPGIKPEADQKQKNPKNDRKPDRAPFPDKKTKYDQKQKPPHNKPTTNQSKPINVPKRVHTSKPDQRTPAHILPTDQNMKNYSKTKHEQDRGPDQKKLPIPKSKTPQKSVLPVQRPTSHHRPKPDKDPLIYQEHETEEIPTVNQNTKPEKKVFHSVKTDKPDGKQKPEIKSKSEETTKPNQMLERSQDPTPLQEPESRRSKTTAFTPLPNGDPVTKSLEKSDESPSLESASKDSTPGQKITPNRANTPPDQKFKPGQKIPKPNQRPVTDSMEKSEENPYLEPTSNQHSTPGQRITPDRAIIPTKQKFKPSQEITKPNQRPVADPIEKSDENPDLEPTSNQDSRPGQKITLDQANTPPDEKPKPGQKISKFNQKPVTESMEKSDETPFLEPTSTQDSIPGQKITPNQAITPLDEKPKPGQNITKPKQKPVPESMEKIHENPTLRPTSNKDLRPGQRITPDQANTPPVEKFNPSQKLTKFNQKPVTDSMAKSDENPYLEPTSNQDSTPGQTITPDQANTPPVEKFNPSQKIPKYNQKTVTESMEKSDENPYLEPTSNQRSTPEQRITPNQANTPPYQKFKPSQKIPYSDQMPVTESMEKYDENPFLEPTPNQDSTTGQKITPNQANIPPDEKPKPSQNITKPKQKPVPESIKKSDENPTLRPTPNQDLRPGQRITPDQANTPPDEKFKPSQEISKFNQKPVSESMEKSDENPYLEPTSNQDSTPGQKIPPDQINTPPDQKFKPSQKIPNSNQMPVTESMEKSDENISSEPTSNEELIHGQKIIPDQSTTPAGQKFKPSQKFSKLNQRPLPDSMEKSDDNPTFKPTSNQDSTTRHKNAPDQANTPPDQKFKPGQKIPNSDQTPVTESVEKPDENSFLKHTSNQDSTPEYKITSNQPSTLLDQKPKPSQKIPKTNQKPKPGQVPKPNQKHAKPVTTLKTKTNVSRKADQAPQTDQRLKTQRPNLNPKSVPDELSRAKSNKTSKLRPPPRYRPPTRPTVEPVATPIQRPKSAVQPEPSPKTKTHLDPPRISWTTTDNIQNSQTDVPPTSGPGKHIAEVTHSPEGTEFSPSMKKTVTLGPKTSNSLENGPFPHLHALSEGFTVSPNSRITSDLKPQTASQPPPIPITTRPKQIMHLMLPSVIPSPGPESTKPNLNLKSDSSSHTKMHHNVDETGPTAPVPSPSQQPTSTLSPDFRSTTLATSGLEPPAAESSTPSTRELRVKINQVAAFLNNSLSSNGRPPVRHPKEHLEDTQGGSRPDRTQLPTPIPSKVSTVRRDCSDHLLAGETDSGVYLVTPDPRGRSFPVFCDMEQDGGGWTVLQRRQDGSVSFNRTWVEYQSGFGDLDGGEFWLGNNMIHQLTRERDMMLRVELEDFDGVREYAQYELFRVASERLRYRLTVGGYSGTAGDALRFDKRYDHNNRAFTTPDRDHDRYPSGNCGAYYSSGWWFDACMAANLNGRYYVGSYKGVRDGIFWGTWHTISTEYYPTNDRQSFKRVRMMIRPKGFAP